MIIQNSKVELKKGMCFGRMAKGHGICHRKCYIMQWGSLCAEEWGISQAFYGMNSSYKGSIFRNEARKYLLCVMPYCWDDGSYSNRKHVADPIYQVVVCECVRLRMQPLLWDNRPWGADVHKAPPYLACVFRLALSTQLALPLKLYYKHSPLS